MKRRSCSYVLTILLTLAGAGYAQAAGATRTRASACAAVEGRITHHHRLPPGLIHVGDDKLYPLPPAVESAFAAA